MLAPICLFTYNRINELQQTVTALKNNFLAKESILFIFSDGPKDSEDKIKVDYVRRYLREIEGFKEITIIESPINNGLANSIISGVTKVIEEYGKVIVLEDDLITSANFLDFMNQALTYYEKYEKVLGISGYSFDLKYPINYSFDAAFGYRISSWGWATWTNRWGKIDWEVSDYKLFKWNLKERIKFNKRGSDLSRLLDKQMQGKVDSWAIRFCYNQFKYNYLDVFPVISKVMNIGFNKNGTNCKTKNGRFITNYDETNKRDFKFDNKLEINYKLMKQFYHHYSFKTRVIEKFSGFLAYVWKKSLIR